ncbi:MAG: serine hydrolase domain-containing protein, partial [Gemmatimonadales bacterium]
MLSRSKPPRVWLCAVVLLVCPGCRAAPRSAPPGDSTWAAALQRTLDSVRRDLDAPGAVLGVARGDQFPTVVATGLANLESATPMLPDQAYFLGSISKVYTAAAVLRLVENGVLALDDSLARFLPSFPDANRITIRMLLQHTSGLKDFYAYLYYRPDRAEMIRLVTKRWTEDELLGLAARFGRWFEPGTDWSYSSTNYYLLGVIVERLTGSSLAEAYRRLLFEPLEIRHTWLTLHEEPRGTLPTGYLGPVESWSHSAMFGELGPTSVLDTSSVEWGAGGLATPAVDALRFLSGLFRDRIVSSAILEVMTDFRETPSLGVTDSASTEESDGYGLGVVR